jgi:hypothetical protein
MPVFTGVSTLSDEGWTYAVRGDALEGTILEARGVLKIVAPRSDFRLRVEAVPGGAIYVSNQGKARVDAEWGKGQVRRKLALKPEETRTLTD